MSQSFTGPTSQISPQPAIRFIQASTPGSPNDGDLWLDTAFAALQYPPFIWQWDAGASLWLSLQRFKNGVLINNGTGTSVSTNFYFATLPEILNGVSPNVFIDNLYATAYVAAPNGIGNSWAINLGKVTVGNVTTMFTGAGQNIGTAASTAANWVNYAAHNFRLNISPATFPSMLIQLIITGAPGLIYGALGYNYRWVHP